MALPFGWTLKDLEQAAGLAASYGTPLEDILGIWFSESGLNWRNSAMGYYGLIMGNDAFVTQVAGMEPGRWRNIVLNESLSTQLLAIKRFWDGQIRQWLSAPVGREEIALKTRAANLGITPAGLLYGINFVPAYASRMKTADQPMVRSADAGGGDPNAIDSEARYYRDNPDFDITKKGYISLRDMDIRISAFKARARASKKTESLFTEGADIVPVSYTTPGPETDKTKKPSIFWPIFIGGTVIAGSLALATLYIERKL